MYFLAEPMESGTYSDDHILLYCVYRHESHMVVIVNSTMVGDALECFRTAFPLEMWIEICQVNKLISGK